MKRIGRALCGLSMPFAMVVLAACHSGTAGVTETSTNQRSASIPTKAIKVSAATDFGEVVLPKSVWQILQRAKGIRVGGSPAATIKIQVIFDPNCPYCARLYLKLKQQYPTVPIRWVPIAYLVASSGPRGAAILQSKDPAASLDADFTQYVYDFKKSHGGYKIPAGKQFILPRENVQLEKRCTQWGGATPMIIFKNSTGEVVRALGEADDTIRQVMQQADKSGSLKTYQ